MTYQLVKISFGYFATGGNESKVVAVSTDKNALEEYCQKTLGSKIQPIGTDASTDFEDYPMYFINESEIVSVEPKEIEVNINSYGTIYPSEKGFEAIKQQIMREFLLSEENADKRIKKLTTEDGGYREQIWTLFQDQGPMFYNGTNELKNSTLKIEKL